MNDHVSGCQMNPVLGRGRVMSSSVIIPVARATTARTSTTATAKANESTSSRTLRSTSPHRRSTRPAEIAAIALNSGPTTIAPTTRTDESVITAIAASATASTRNTWKEMVGTAPASAWASTESQMTASSGWPGALASRSRARSNGRARRRGEHDAAALRKAQSVQPLEQRAGLLAGHVGLEQVAGRVQDRPGLEGHVGRALVLDQQVTDGVGQVGRDGQPEVDEHPRSVGLRRRGPAPGRRGRGG